MALTKNPKLALIPIGYKASKVYSVLPSDGVGDFDFSRSGNATRVNKQGLIETVASNLPRLNYPLIDGVVSGCPSLLLEPARTNLVQYSEDFSGWNGAQFTTLNYAISPNGTQNASRCLFTDINQSLSKNIGTNGTLSYSIYVKGVKGETINISMAAGSDESFLLNGEWQRLSYSNTVSNSVININTYGNKTARDLLIWGAQLEVGSFPTSYIPSLTGSQTTRSAETCNNAGDVNTFNDSEGVLMAEISTLEDSLTGYLSLSNGSTTQVRLGFLYGDLYTQIRIDNNVLYSHSENGILTQNNKLAIFWNNNTQKFFVNGFSVDTGALDTTISANTLNKLSFDIGTGGGPFHGNAKQIQYFDTALTDTDLETLTSWTSFNEMATSQLYTIQ